MRVCFLLVLLTTSVPTTSAQAGQVLAEQKINEGHGGFGGSLSAVNRFGESCAFLGDLEGDGHVSVAVGAAGDSEAYAGAGAVWVLELDSSGVAVSEKKLAYGIGGHGTAWPHGGSFGEDVAGLGDLDGDGIADLAVGAPSGGSGELWILFLNGDGSVKAETRIDNVALGGVLDPLDAFGHSVGDLGDLDGDGVVDLVVGAPGDDDGGVDRGAAWILFLNADGSVENSVKISSTQGGFSGLLLDQAYFGYAAEGIGDLDSDGAVDVAVGAPGFGSAAWILRLSPPGTVLTQQRIGPLAGDSSNFAYALGRLPDLNQDGRDDLAIGETSGGGRVWILFLEASGSFACSGRISSGVGGFVGGTGQLHFGSAIASLGDLDGNGSEDILVGDRNDSEFESSAGAAWVLSLDAQDIVPPSIACPADLFVRDSKSGPPGETVTFQVTAEGACTVSCFPPSGSRFPPGKTVVTCIALDSSGNQASCSFRVQVGAVSRF